LLTQINQKNALNKMVNSFDSVTGDTNFCKSNGYGANGFFYEQAVFDKFFNILIVRSVVPNTWKKTSNDIIASKMLRES
jgi:hypothetical protein